MAGRFYYVDNVNGSNLYGGTSINDAFATIDKAVDMINSYGTLGGGIRIVYTGVDYTFDSALSYINGSFAAGIGWGEGEYFTLEGIDPSGGYNRPILYPPTDTTTGAAIKFTGSANYWLIRDLYFKYPAGNTTWSSRGLFFANSLLDSNTYFRVERCKFEGKYDESDIYHGQGIYAASGTKMHIEISYCYFKNLGNPIFFYQAAPYPVEVNVHHNVFFGTVRAGASYFILPQRIDGTIVKFTFSNNTILSLGNRYSGIGCYVRHGDFVTRDQIEVANNFCFYVNRFLASDTDDVTVFADVTHSVGYNTWGKTNSASAGYEGAFNICEVDPVTYSAPGDYSIYSYDLSDLTTIFKDYTAETYLWPDATWITIPDLRPLDTTLMIGTIHDATAFRGAVQYSGVYVDSSVETNHQAIVLPYYRPQLIEYTNDLASDFHLLGDADLTSGFSVQFTNNTVFNLHEWATYGGISNTSLVYSGYDAGTKYVLTTDVTTTNLYPEYAANYAVYVRTQTRFIDSGGSEVQIGAWSSVHKGSFTQTVTYPSFLPGSTYHLQARYNTIEDDSTSAWATIYTIYT